MRVMDKHKLDALVAPTGSPAWLTDLVNGDHSGGGSSNAAAVAGYPNINVPAGNLWGLPVGISFFGRAWSEPTLIQAGLCVRAGDKSAHHAEVPADGEVIVLVDRWTLGSQRNHLSARMNEKPPQSTG